MKHGIIIGGKDIPIEIQQGASPLTRDQARQVMAYAIDSTKLADEIGSYFAPGMLCVTSNGFYFPGMEELEKWA